MAPFRDGTIANCLAAHATESTQSAVDACVQRAYAGTEDADEWVSISDQVYACLEVVWPLRPSEPLNEGPLISASVSEVNAALSACADRLAST